MLRVLVLSLFLVAPAVAQKRIHEVVAPGLGECIYYPYARTFEYGEGHWGMKIAAAAYGHDDWGWTYRAYVLIGADYGPFSGGGCNMVAALGNLVLPLSILPASQTQCWGDLEWTAPWMPNLSFYAQVIAHQPGCHDEWQASAVMRIETGSKPN